MPEVKQDPTRQDGTGAGADDFVSHLHKMSTTAGVGAQEYVAISGASIAALVFGLASSLSILNIVLLLIPAAGVVCAAVAFRQIAASNGTLGGRSFAGIGLLLCLGFASYVTVASVRAKMADAEDRKELERIVAVWSDAIKSGNVAPAYETVSDRMKQLAAPPDVYATRMRALRQGFYGELQYMTLGQRLGFTTNESGDRQADGVMEMKFTNAEKLMPREVKFLKIDGRWVVDDMPTIFGPLNGPGAGFRAVGEQIQGARRAATQPAGR